MSTVYGLNKPNTNLKKSGFDLSQNKLFHLSAGMLLPCMVKSCNPGEKFRITLDSITRTMPVNTAAFVRCRQYYHFFFVPFRQLWSGFPNFINGVNKKTTALTANMRAVEIPYIDIMGCMARLLENDVLLKSSDITKQGKSLDEHGFEYFRGMSRLLDLLGYGFEYTYNGVKCTTFTDLVEAMFYVAKTEKSESEIKADSAWPRGRNAINAGYDWDINKRDEKLPLGHPLVVEYLNKIDVSNFRRRIDEIKAIKFKVNPFRILAYQKINSDFYKRDDYEATDPRVFNIDDVERIDYSTGGKTTEELVQRILGIFRMRYRYLAKDYFTGVVPSELFDGLNADNVPNNPTSLLDWFTAGADSSSGNLIKDGNKVMLTGDVNTRSVRAMFAIEKLLRLTRRAGQNDYISQTLAHFGFKPPKGLGDDVEYFGGVSYNVDITEVVTNAMSQDASTGRSADVGQIFGRGIGTSDSKGSYIDYEAKEHGLIMCITSIVPDLSYNSDGLDLENAKFKRGSYFQPELQDLGLQPVYGFELRNKLSTTNEVNTFNSDTSKNGYIVGFGPRYAEYKVSYDMLHGEFRNGKSLSAWSATSLLASNETGVLINTLKVNPKCLNRIFAVKYDGKESSDQFFVAATFGIKAIRPMSITGQNL